MRNEVINAPIDQVFDAVIKATERCNIKIDTKNRKKGKITAKNGASALSWGEKITINICGDVTETRVEISSVSKSRLGDQNRKNRKNEDKIFQKLYELLPNSRKEKKKFTPVVNQITGSDKNNNSVILSLNNEGLQLIKKGLYTGRDKGNQFIKIDDITSIDFKKGLVLGTVKITVPGGKIKVKNVASNQGAAFVSNVQNKIIQTKTQVPNVNTAVETIDPIEKIKKTKELLDIGAITQEEFEEIKNKLLKDI